MIVCGLPKLNFTQQMNNISVVLKFHGGGWCWGVKMSREALKKI